MDTGNTNPNEARVSGQSEGGASNPAGGTPTAPYSPAPAPATPYSPAPTGATTPMPPAGGYAYPPEPVPNPAPPQQRSILGPLLLILGGLLLLVLICAGIATAVGWFTVSSITGNIRTLEVGELKTEEQTVPLGGAKSVGVDLSMGAGELALAGGASELLETRFTYNVDEWQPQVQYEVSGQRGTLKVEQPEKGLAITESNAENNWDLKLNGEVPMDARISLGAGKSDLKLGDLNLKSLDINTGAGETRLDLTGDWDESLKATINAGVGETTILLPAGTGVRVIADQGIGDIEAGGLKRDGDVYTNDAYGTSEVNLDISVRTGIGKLILEQQQ